MENETLRINDEERGENYVVGKNIVAKKAEKFHRKGITGPELLNNMPSGVMACPFVEHGCHKVGNEMEVKLHERDDRWNYELYIIDVAPELMQKYSLITVKDKLSEKILFGATSSCPLAMRGGEIAKEPLTYAA
ncbi:unnamed protein product [Angiostrongylus costaricensis]|uniref:Peptidase_M24 domain-containing protein n=1 Tax=Angiostrongylus costaricensis TaxID=334426 RepID=A0A0R3PJW8_ANGCS|nr:unnamed protein product [Angiostrongylus costaricensis]